MDLGQGPLVITAIAALPAEEDLNHYGLHALKNYTLAACVLLDQHEENTEEELLAAAAGRGDPLGRARPQTDKVGKADAADRRKRAQ